MTCERIQELILTDYLDGQMEDNLKASVQQHLASCKDCLEFAHTAQRAVFKPFVDAVPESPPERVWLNIAETIQTRQDRSDVMGRFIKWLSSFQSVPRPVFALMSVIFMVLAISTLSDMFFNVASPVFKESNIKKLNRQSISVFNPGVHKQDRSVKEQIDYLDALTNLASSASLDELNGYDTALEKYFL